MCFKILFKSIKLTLEIKVGIEWILAHFDFKRKSTLI